VFLPGTVRNLRGASAASDGQLSFRRIGRPVRRLGRSGTMGRRRRRPIRWIRWVPRPALGRSFAMGDGARNLGILPPVSPFIASRRVGWETDRQPCLLFQQLGWRPHFQRLLRDPAGKRKEDLRSHHGKRRSLVTQARAWAWKGSSWCRRSGGHPRHRSMGSGGRGRCG